jgi:gliding motility-associated-like protein
LATIKNPIDTFFKDNKVSIGNHYCYLVTAVLENHTESCLSQQECGELSFSVPILTRVSIVTTAIDTGTDTVLWQNPSDLDLVQYTGPYQYKLYSALGNGTPNTLVFSSSTQSILANCDTLFVHNNLNTNDSAYNYRVELWNNGILVGSSSPSESVFLSLTPNDNQMGLVWNINTTWQVDSSEIFRETIPGSGIFNSLARTTARDYIDSGLINGKEYCYKIKTFGHYSLPQIQQPLINWSQIACASPTDKTSPCAPVLQLQQDCKVGLNTLLWNNPNHSCADDVTHYALYYAAQEDGQFAKIEELSTANDTVFKHSTSYGVVGCYYVTAFDSIQYNNESAPSNILCVDNCPPEYTLPNVITLNGDGTNDFFHPLLPYRYVDSIDCLIFNRWGETIFETQNPMINWDGRENKKGKSVSEGVYYYLCKVYYLSLKGRKSIDLQGFFHVIRPK